MIFIKSYCMYIWQGQLVKSMSNIPRPCACSSGRRVGECTAVQRGKWAAGRAQRRGGTPPREVPPLRVVRVLALARVITARPPVHRRRVHTCRTLVRVGESSLRNHQRSGGGYMNEFAGSGGDACCGCCSAMGVERRMITMSLSECAEKIKSTKSLAKGTRHVSRREVAAAAATAGDTVYRRWRLRAMPPGPKESGVVVGACYASAGLPQGMVGL